MRFPTNHISWRHRLHTVGREQGLDFPVQHGSAVWELWMHVETQVQQLPLDDKLNRTTIAFEEHYNNNKQTNKKTAKKTSPIINSTAKTKQIMQCLLACNFVICNHRFDYFWQLAYNWTRLCNWETERLDGSTVKQISWERRHTVALHAGRQHTRVHAEDPQEEGSLLQISHMKPLTLGSTYIGLPSKLQQHLNICQSQFQCPVLLGETGWRTRNLNGN